MAELTESPGRARGTHSGVRCRSTATSESPCGLWWARLPQLRRAEHRAPSLTHGLASDAECAHVPARVQGWESEYRAGDPAVSSHAGLWLPSATCIYSHSQAAAPSL